jgi:hypothetical protein
MTCPRVLSAKGWVEIKRGITPELPAVRKWVYTSCGETVWAQVEVTSTGLGSVRQGGS